jgi:hypothetical protein
MSRWTSPDTITSLVTVDVTLDVSPAPDTITSLVTVDVTLDVSPAPDSITSLVTVDVTLDVSPAPDTVTSKICFPASNFQSEQAAARYFVMSTNIFT